MIISISSDCVLDVDDCLFLFLRCRSSCDFDDVDAVDEDSDAEDKTDDEELFERFRLQFSSVRLGDSSYVI